MHSVVVKESRLSRPELAFIIGTRAMLGAGIALLLADRLSTEQRKAVGATLALIGLVTTIPAAWAVFGSTTQSHLRLVREASEIDADHV